MKEAERLTPLLHAGVTAVIGPGRTLYRIKGPHETFQSGLVCFL